MTNQLQTYPDYKSSDIRLLGGGINGFLRHEVLPYTPNARYDPASGVKTGYEINFTRHFYKPMPMRSLKEIRADILAVKRERGDL